MAPHVTQGTVIGELKEERFTVAQPAKGCTRCGGMMVRSRYIDMLDDTGQLEFVAERCIQCGDVVDPVIRSNRIRQVAMHHQRAPQELSRVA